MAATSSMSMRTNNKAAASSISTSSSSTIIPSIGSTRIRARSELALTLSLADPSSNRATSTDISSSSGGSSSGGTQRRIAEVWQAEVTRQLDELTNIELTIQRATSHLHEATTSQQVNKELAAIVKQLKQLTDKIKIMSDEAASQDSASDTDFIVQRLAKHSAIADELQSCARRAALAAHRSLEQLSDTERKELLGDNAGKKEALANDSVQRSRQLTEALKRTHQALQSQLDRSSAALNALNNSSHTLEEANDEYAGMGGDVSRGAGLITRLHIRERTDRWMVVIGIMFFIMTCLVIIRGRIGPRLPNVTSFIWGSPVTPEAFLPSST